MSSDDFGWGFSTGSPHLKSNFGNFSGAPVQRNYASMNAGFKIPDPREFAQAVLEIRFRNPRVVRGGMVLAKGGIGTAVPISQTQMKHSTSDYRFCLLFDGLFFNNSQAVL